VLVIRVIQNAAMPQFRFEWHPETGKVYWMSRPVPGQSVQAFVLAEHCDTEGRAFGFVQTFCRGYRAAKGELLAPADGGPKVQVTDEREGKERV
jgi:hypothetical protein